MCRCRRCGFLRVHIDGYDISRNCTQPLPLERIFLQTFKLQVGNTDIEDDALQTICRLLNLTVTSCQMQWFYRNYGNARHECMHGAQRTAGASIQQRNSVLSCHGKITNSFEMDVFSALSTCLCCLKVICAVKSNGLRCNLLVAPTKLACPDAIQSSFLRHFDLSEDFAFSRYNLAPWEIAP